MTVDQLKKQLSANVCVKKNQIMVQLIRRGGLCNLIQCNGSSFRAWWIMAF